MSFPIDQFLRRFVLYRRIVAVICVLSFAASFTIAWILLLGVLDRWLMLSFLIRTGGLVVGGLVVLVILLPRVWKLFRPVDLVEAAIQVERLRPAFDQRLITVASNPGDSPMVNQLRAEAEQLMVLIRLGSLVPLRWIWIGMAALAISAGTFIFCQHRLPLRRIYSPLPASSKINSTSTAASRGRVLAPMAARA